MNINYVFLRHGYGCHNAISALYKEGKLTVNEVKISNDPVLTTEGINASVNNGSVIGKLLKTIDIKNEKWVESEVAVLPYNDNYINLYEIKSKDYVDLSVINVIGCSSLIRSMETAYYMTRSWINPPNKIYVFPYLREINESDTNKYSSNSIYIMNTNPSYAMKELYEQKEYLKSKGILKFFDFSFVEKFYGGRYAPGDINKFIEWFCRYFIFDISNTTKINVMIITHAGVLKDFSNEGFINNSGFILTTNFNKNKVKYKKYVSLNPLLSDNFYKNYDNSLFLKNCIRRPI